MYTYFYCCQKGVRVAYIRPLSLFYCPFFDKEYFDAEVLVITRLSYFFPPMRLIYVDA